MPRDVIIIYSVIHPAVVNMAYNQDFYQSNLTLEDNQEQQLPPQQYVASVQQQQWSQGGYPYGAYVGATAGT